MRKKRKRTQKKKAQTADVFNKFHGWFVFL